MAERDISDTVAAIKAIMDRVEARVERLSGTEYQIEQVLRETADLRADLMRIQKTLHIGNGAPPVIQRLMLIETSLLEMREQSKRSNREKATLVVALITTLGSVAAAWIAASSNIA